VLELRFHLNCCFELKKLYQTTFNLRLQHRGEGYHLHLEQAIDWPQINLENITLVKQVKPNLKIHRLNTKTRKKDARGLQNLSVNNIR
jgi:hypothetical protein